MQFFIKNCGALGEHVRRFHSKGCCWNDSDHSDALKRERLVQSVREEIELGKLEEETLANLDTAVANDVRLLVKNSDREQRLRLLQKIELDRQAAIKAAGKDFARQQIAKLLALGFSQATAIGIMKAAGPGRAVVAAEWAIGAVKELAARYARNYPDACWSARAAMDALDCLLGNPGGTRAFGKNRMGSALRAIGIEPPVASSSGAFFAILRGAKEALYDVPIPELSLEVTT